jgi:hypothetical protein
MGEVSATTIADHGVSGVCNKFPRNETLFAGSKNESSCGILPRSDSTTGVFCQDNSQGDRETDIIYAGSFPSTLALSTPAKVANKRSVEGKIKGLFRGKSYETMVSLNHNCRNDLQWWIEQIPIWNGRAIIAPAPDLVITTDASMRGWGAVCQGVHTRGLWTP